MIAVCKTEMKFLGVLEVMQQIMALRKPTTANIQHCHIETKSRKKQLESELDSKMLPFKKENEEYLLFILKAFRK